MNVRFLPQAEADLSEIGDHIARDNPRRAASFTRELREKCLDLKDFPHAFPMFGDADIGRIRRRNHRRYAILYVVENEAINILRIVHGARDLPALL